MSVITFTNGAQARIYGTLAGAKAYLGSTTTTWDAVLTDETLQRLLVKAGRYLDHLPWAVAYQTFAARDALDLADGSIGDAAFPFRAASYELAVMAQADESILTVPDQGSNIASAYAGGAGVTYFRPTSSMNGSAALLPPILMKLIGPYLAFYGLDISAEGGTGESESCVNPFGPCADFDKTRPW